MVSEVADLCLKAKHFSGKCCLAKGFGGLAGHVVAVRVTSEDANAGFKPTCGSIDELSFRTSPDVWGYFSVKSGGGIHEFSDSQARLCPTWDTASASQSVLTACYPVKRARALHHERWWSQDGLMKSAVPVRALHTALQ